MRTVRYMRREFAIALLFLLIMAAAAAYVKRAQIQAREVSSGSFGHTIVLDAGHGGFDGGAVGVSGAKEASINLAVAKALRERLIASGVKVIMTRETDEALGETKNADMAFRKSVIEKPGVELVVSVHMNKFSNARVNGPQVFHMPKSQEGEKLARIILSELNLATGKNKREVHSENFFMLRNTKAPAVIVECGFMSNAAEEKLLLDAAYQQTLADAIFAGIEKYYATL